MSIFGRIMEETAGTPRPPRHAVGLTVKGAKAKHHAIAKFNLHTQAALDHLTHAYALRDVINSGKRPEADPVEAKRGEWARLQREGHLQHAVHHLNEARKLHKVNGKHYPQLDLDTLKVPRGSTIDEALGKEYDKMGPAIRSYGVLPEDEHY